MLANFFCHISQWWEIRKSGRVTLNFDLWPWNSICSCGCQDTCSHKILSSKVQLFSSHLGNREKRKQKKICHNAENNTVLTKMQTMNIKEDTNYAEKQNDDGNIPVPMPVTTVWSVPPIIPAETTDGVMGPCGAMLGKYIQPKPSQLISNSTNDGVMAAPCRRMSRGVVIETRHFTRVSNTGPPTHTHK